MKPRVGIISLGCPRNLVDSETVASCLAQKHIPITRIEDADTVIVNTCAFIREAKEESVRTIIDLVELKRQGAIKKIIVQGCLVQRYKHQLAKHLKGVDAFIGRLPLNGKVLRTHPLTPRHFAYVKIVEGCGNRCSYCVIPAIKGALCSAPRESILRHVKALDRAGTREINLVGQDITLYGVERYGKPQLVGLLKDILRQAKNIRWIRLLYLHPAHINNELLELIAAEERICKYVDVPIQHCNDRILRLMNRGITKQKILSVLGKIRRTIPGVFIRTSVMVGFPSEAEKEFDELIDFIRTVRFERLGAFTYSREEGTKAYSFPGQVHPKVKQSRFNQIMSAQRGIATQVNKALLDSLRNVMIDERDSDNAHRFVGRLEQDAPEVDGSVYIKSSRELIPGKIYRTKIIDTTEYDLVGELV